MHKQLTATTRPSLAITLTIFASGSVLGNFAQRGYLDAKRVYGSGGSNANAPTSSDP